MIAKLTGTIDKILDNAFIIDVNGVGYLVYASSTTLRKIGGKGANVSIMIETHVREDHIHLYGFADAQEKEWFQILCTVQGVGTKVALAILSINEPSDLIMSIAAGDKAVVQQADGVGPKLATRIITELKEKAAKMSLGGPSPSGAQGGAALGNGGDVSAQIGGHGMAQDAVSALVNLGYGQTEAFKAIREILSNDNAPSDVGTLIREGLKALSGGK